mmetsp:Transcript_51900/g.76923  ORF Transcript_51900/g.76923 Transcript_51900/m.76923 type:complete len:170 (-) Transcript_51900:13-522(-)
MAFAGIKCSEKTRRTENARDPTALKVAIETFSENLLAELVFAKYISRLSSWKFNICGERDIRIGKHDPFQMIAKHGDGRTTVTSSQSFFLQELALLLEKKELVPAMKAMSPMLASAKTKLPFQTKLVVIAVMTKRRNIMGISQLKQIVSNACTHSVSLKRAEQCMYEHV